MDLLRVSNICKQIQGVPLLKNISFTQKKLQKLAIAGETGSGKSTLLKIIAGLVQTDEGSVLFEDVKVKGPDERLIAGEPGIAYLSQHFELRNHHRVEEILAYANTLTDEASEELYKVCRIDHLLKRRTDQLSGGEKQRIALARLLTLSPRLLVLDEPFSNLDMIHKSILKAVIEDVGEKLGTSCILVSHDPLDLLSWADEIMIMKDGQIIQQGSPEQIYTQPVNEYAAGLFGKYNLVNLSLTQAFPGLQQLVLSRKNMFIRPEQFKITTDENQGLKGVVHKKRFLGSYYELDVMISNDLITIKTENSALKPGDTLFVSLALRLF